MTEVRRGGDDSTQPTNSLFFSFFSVMLLLGISRLLTDTEMSTEQAQYVAMINNSGQLLLSIINVRRERNNAYGLPELSVSLRGVRAPC